MSDPSSPKVAQPTERMTAEQWRSLEHFRKYGMEHFNSDMPVYHLGYHDGCKWTTAEAKAYAEHYTAATTRELESSVALVRELATALQEIKSWKEDQLSGDYLESPENAAFRRGVRMAFYRCATRVDALLSRDDVKKALEEKEAKKEEG